MPGLERGSSDTATGSAASDAHDDHPAQVPPELDVFDFALGPALAGLRGRQSLLIYMHDNPDPDALAAAFGLKRVVENALPIKATLALAASWAAPRTAPWWKPSGSRCSQPRH